MSNLDALGEPQSQSSADDPENKLDGRVRSSYGVKLVRGPFIKLPSHPDRATTKSELVDLVGRMRESNPEVRLVADLFSGAGGLSLGLERAGFSTVVAVDHYSEAV